MANAHRTDPGFSWCDVVPVEASLPTFANMDGDFRFALAEETLHFWKEGAWHPYASGGGGSSNWGSIGGDIQDQADLIALFDTKLDLAGGTVSGTLNLGNLTASRFLTLDGSKNVISPTGATATGMLDAFTGDSGSGGVKGLVPAPASGDAAANKFLKANGSWTAISGSVSGPVSSTDNAQVRWNGTGGSTLQDGKWIEDDDGRIVVDIGNTSSGTTYGTRWTATLTGTAGAVHAIERLDVTTAGSGAGAFVLGRWVRLLAGYTGGGMCAGDWVINNCSSTGTDLNGGGGNMGYRSVMGGSGTGHFAAYYGNASGSGARTYGSIMELEGGPSSGVQVGFSTSVNPGSGTLKAACFYGKLTGTVGQVPNVTAAAVFDNAATTFPGLVVQDNSATMFQVTDGANVVCGALAALATTATDGFPYIPTCAGVPTGVPTAFTGKVAMVFDSTNNNLYLYNGAWKKTTTFA